MDTIMMCGRRVAIVLAVVAPGIAAADNPPPEPAPPQQPQPPPAPQPPPQQQPYPGPPPYQGQPPAPYPGQAPAPYPGQAPAPYPGQYPAPYPYPYPYPPQQRPAPIGPAEITDFDESQPVRPGYTLVKRKHKGLLIGGGITLGISYMIAVLVAASDDDSHRNDPTVPTHDGLWIPVFGPFLELGSSSSSSTSGSSNSTVGYLELGLAESAGAALLAIGLTSEKKVLVRNDQLTMSLMPMVGHGASGVMAFGSF